MKCRASLAEMMCVYMYVQRRDSLLSLLEEEDQRGELWMQVEEDVQLMDVREELLIGWEQEDMYAHDWL